MPKRGCYEGNVWGNIKGLLKFNALFFLLQKETRSVRRSIARYTILSSVLAWRSISLRVLKRYPTDDHLVHSGLITREELEIFHSVQVTIDPHQVRSLSPEALKIITDISFRNGSFH
jgi:hypothetical protein